MKFIDKMLRHYPNVIFVDIPKARRYMHPDTIFNRIRDNLALVYLPAFNDTWLFTEDGDKERIDFSRFMQNRGVELINVTDEEQRRLACTFVPLDQGIIFHYDDALSMDTQQKLAQKGVELILFHPDALHAGGGSLRCLTLRLHRNRE
jgi:arginine deiminase